MSNQQRQLTSSEATTGKSRLVNNTGNDGGIDGGSAGSRKGFAIVHTVQI